MDDLASVLAAAGLKSQGKSTPMVQQKRSTAPGMSAGSPAWGMGNQGSYNSGMGSNTNRGMGSMNKGPSIGISSGAFADLGQMAAGMASKPTVNSGDVGGSRYGSSTGSSNRSSGIDDVFGGVKVDPPSSQPSKASATSASAFDDLLNSGFEVPKKNDQPSSRPTMPPSSGSVDDFLGGFGSSSKPASSSTKDFFPSDGGFTPPRSSKPSSNRSSAAHVSDGPAASSDSTTATAGSAAFDPFSTSDPLFSTPPMGATPAPPSYAPDPFDPFSMPPAAGAGAAAAGAAAGSVAGTPARASATDPDIGLADLESFAASQPTKQAATPAKSESKQARASAASRQQEEGKERAAEGRRGESEAAWLTVEQVRLRTNPNVTPPPPARPPPRRPRGSAPPPPQADGNGGGGVHPFSQAAAAAGASAAGAYASASGARASSRAQEDGAEGRGGGGGGMPSRRQRAAEETDETSGSRFDSSAGSASAAASASASAMKDVFERAQRKAESAKEERAREKQREASAPPPPPPSAASTTSVPPPRAPSPRQQPRPAAAAAAQPPPSAGPDLFGSSTAANGAASSRQQADTRQRQAQAAQPPSSADAWADILGGGSAPSGMPTSASSGLPEGFQEVAGESEERRRLRLERLQKVQERSQAALDEKKRRDADAVKEQEDRHKAGEMLDAEIKRWAAGKEGNLRALLSTLQFVLWPEAKWEALNLTDLITAPAVKKAYRKAALCVHPDKVQQKGATVQQKYIAEKVFDLLKEAFNKFNSEELF